MAKSIMRGSEWNILAAQILHKLSETEAELTIKIWPLLLRFYMFNTLSVL